MSVPVINALFNLGKGVGCPLYGDYTGICSPFTVIRYPFSNFTICVKIPASQTIYLYSAHYCALFIKCITLSLSLPITLYTVLY